MSSPFLQLPTEIRLCMYRLLLPYSKYHVEDQKKDSPVRWYPGECHAPGILLVNRQIHQEAAEILYHENFFAIYVKHPQEPRLPMNDSRADPESFMFVSWAKSPKMIEPRMNPACAWAHPQNPRVPYSDLENHQNFHLIRKFYISLPSFDGLSGVDMFMKKTSFPAFYGVKAWIKGCAKNGGYLDVEDRKRMSIVQQFKDPIDKLGRLLHTSDRIDQLCISVPEPKFQITFSVYLLEELLKVDVVGSVACDFAQPFMKHRNMPVCILGRNWPRTENRKMDPDVSELKRWAELLKSTPKKPREVSHLPPETDDMYQLLRAIQSHQQLDTVSMPDWLSPMPA